MRYLIRAVIWLALIPLFSRHVPPDKQRLELAFAIPSNMVIAVVRHLIQYGQVPRGTIGALVQNLTPSLIRNLSLPIYQGVIVTQVDHGSPAEAAGFTIRRCDHDAQ